MAVPKKKHSKSRKNKRRSQWVLTAPQLTLCPHCHQERASHRVCPHCGYYGGRLIIDHDAEA
jgi:large subunit ribosomal protein L32